VKNLRAVTKDILKRVEVETGKPVQFMRDEKLPLLATMQMARHGADFHVLRYQPTDEPLDYLVVYQAGFVLRLFANAPDQRFDFVPAGDAGRRVEPLVSASANLGDADRQMLPDFAKFVAQWALMNVRSYPIGMRIDQWIATELPELRELQSASLAEQQQQNAGLLSFKRGRLTIPMALMGSVAAYALFVDRLAGGGTYAVPYEASGLLTRAEELLAVWDSVSSEPAHDRVLVDRWAAADGLAGWYTWTPYRP
jgi:hypothetical protein